MAVFFCIMPKALSTRYFSLYSALLTYLFHYTCSLLYYTYLYMANEFVRYYYENRYVYITSDEFSNGIAAVKKGGKWGYIDETGREVVPCV